MVAMGSLSEPLREHPHVVPEPETAVERAGAAVPVQDARRSSRPPRDCTNDSASAISAVPRAGHLAASLAPQEVVRLPRNRDQQMPHLRVLGV